MSFYIYFLIIHNLRITTDTAQRIQSVFKIILPVLACWTYFDGLQLPAKVTMDPVLWVPAAAMDQIKKLFASLVTLTHKHEKITYQPKIPSKPPSNDITGFSGPVVGSSSAKPQTTGRAFRGWMAFLGILTIRWFLCTFQSTHHPIT